MPRYFFHIEKEGRQIVDPEGIDLHDLDAAREEALESARQLMSDDVRNGREPNGRRFVITNEAGIVLLELPFRKAIG